MTDHDLWRHLEAEFARQMAEAPKPKGPAPEQLDALAQEAQERGEYGEAREK